MLVLTRKRGEKLVVGEGVIITITELDRHRVRIGIEAPSDVRILRGELVGLAADRDSEPVLSSCRLTDTPQAGGPGWRGLRRLRRVPALERPVTSNRMAKPWTSKRSELTQKQHELLEKRKVLHGNRRKLHERLSEVC